MRLFQKGTFGLLFFAVVRFSPPSPENEATKRKAKAKNNSPDSQEPTFNSWLRPMGEAQGRAVFIRVNLCLRKRVFVVRSVKSVVNLNPCSSALIRV